MSAGVLAHRPRAYVAAPVASVTGLFPAIDWAFDQARDLTWGDLRILVPGPALVTRLSPLQRLTSRGVRIDTAEQAAGARSIHGMVLAYCPDATMLTAAEAMPGVRAVAAVALHNDQLVEMGGRLRIPAHGSAPWAVMTAGTAPRAWMGSTSMTVLRPSLGVAWASWCYRITVFRSICASHFS